MGDVSRHMSLNELKAVFAHEIGTDKRAAAATAYALAVYYRNQDVKGYRRFDLAKYWANRSIDLLDALPSDKLDQIVSPAISIGGVPIPDFLYSDLVRRRLADVLI